MTLTINEDRYYRTTLIAKVTTLPKGLKFFPAYLFDPLYPSARLCRKLYEDVRDGKVPSLRLVGTLSREGYVVV